VKPTAHRTAIALLAIPLIGALDWATGPEITFSLLYLAPVAFVAWQRTRRIAFTASALSALTWIAVDFVLDRVDANGAIYVWNFAARFVPLIVVSVLLTRLREVLAREQERSSTDALTGAINRRAMRELADGELARARRHRRPLTVVYFDVDDFKSVNDRLGHASGDRLLKSIVSAIRPQLRLTDAIARWGGDEFVLLLPETSGDMARAVLDKIVRQLTETMQQRDWTVTFSIGVVTTEDATQTFDDLLGTTDQLMYQQKGHRNNGASYASLGT
jgi:diguanylate cyclase (GGDEF)-like protein